MSRLNPLASVVAFCAWAVVGCGVEITGIEPECGVPGETATIYGRGFLRYYAKDAVLTVGGLEAEVTAITYSSITFVVPDAVMPGPVQVVATALEKEKSVHWQICNSVPDVCVGPPAVDCDDGNDCTTDKCDPIDGACSHDPVIDEMPCDGGNGTCRAGVCQPNCIPTGVEACDGIDNDCNGLIDDDIEDLATGTDVGECQSKIQRCENGVFVTVQESVEPTTEICDGLDNDCSGLQDDGLIDIISGSNVGECEFEIQRCLAGAYVVVQPATGPLHEVCDGLDNDCNGAPDDIPLCDPVNDACRSLPTFGQPCDTGKAPPCTDGINTCYQGDLVCETTAPVELDLPNDGVDQNCSGTDLLIDGNTPAIPGRSEVLADLDLPPAPGGASGYYLGEGAQATIVVDPDSRSPVTAAGECMAIILACFQPDVRNLEGCLSQAPTCTSEVPWIGDDPLCCPLQCTRRFEELGRLGLQEIDALMGAVYGTPSCVPGLDDARTEAP